mgnify:CR=1 FL=1
MNQKIYKLAISFADFFLDAERLLNNAQVEPRIRDALAGYGYDAARFATGMAYLEAARRSYHQQQDALAARVAATAAVNESWRAARRSLKPLLALARLAFHEDIEAQTTLDLGERASSRTAWLAQARRFYQHLLATPTYLEQLGTYNVTVEQLTAGLAQLETLEAHIQAQQAAQGAAREALSARNNAIQTLDECLKELRTLARIALAADPQLLEALGIVVRS